MEPEFDNETSGPREVFEGRPRHAAGAGLGLVGLLAGSALFSGSVIIGFYLWGVKHHFYLFAAAVAIGAAANFILRRLSVR